MNQHTQSTPDETGTVPALGPSLQTDAAAVRSLAGLWWFAWLGDVEPDAVDLRAPCAERMLVPACFDTFPDHAGQRGLVRYEQQITVERPGRHRLWLDGAHHWVRVLLDGRRIGEHVGGFTRFALELRELTAGEHTLTLLVDNRLDPGRCPLHQGYFDWYHYGGIARGAWLERLSATWIERLDVTTENEQARRVRVRIAYGHAGGGGGASLRVRVNGETLCEEHVPLTGSGAIERTLELPEAELWSPPRPALHTLDVRLGEAQRSLRFGIRRVWIEGERLMLNGEPLHLRGVCRHEISEPDGHTQPTPLLLADLQRLRQLGVNFLRGSHYPQDERFLDLCDELGILVWCEATAWQPRLDHLTDPRFLAAHRRIVEEMVAAACHHPCVIMWGVFNEGDAFEEAARPAYAQALGLLRGLDPTRPVTAAMHRISECRCLDLVDLVAVNAYPGWYGSEIAGVPAELEAVRRHVHARGGGGKPLLISELGGGAIYGHRDAFGDRWSEQYQDRLLDAALGHVLGRPEQYLGIVIWQFADGRTSECATPALMRPRGFNNKGLFDEHRRPKLAAATVRHHFHAAAQQDEARDAGQ